VPFALAGARYMASMAWSRIGGTYRENPFFGAQGAAIVAPHVLAKAEREALMARV
jgi:hypothetical protein